MNAKATATAMMTPHSTRLRSRPSLASRAMGSGSERSPPGGLGAPPASATFTDGILSRPRTRAATSGPSDRKHVHLASRTTQRAFRSSTGFRAPVPRAPPRRGGAPDVPPLRWIHDDGFGADLQEDPLEPRRLGHGHDDALATVGKILRRFRGCALGDPARAAGQLDRDARVVGPGVVDGRTG